MIRRLTVRILHTLVTRLTTDEPSAEPAPAEVADEQLVRPQPPESLAIIWAGLVAMWDHEADRFWVRNNVLMIANGVLIGYFVQNHDNQTAAFNRSLVALGVVLGAIWLIVNLKGSYYVNRWRPAIEKYEAFLASSDYDFGPMPMSVVRSDRVTDFAAINGRGFTRKVGRVLRGTYVPKTDAGQHVHLMALLAIVGWVTIGIIELGSSIVPPL